MSEQGTPTPQDEQRIDLLDALTQNLEYQESLALLMSVGADNIGPAHPNAIASLLSFNLELAKKSHDLAKQLAEHG